MKLIDKDAIPWDVEGIGEIPVITKEEVDEMPTVDAIPVEWIKEFTEESKRHIQGSVNNYTYMYDYMLSEWKQRKEE